MATQYHCLYKPLGRCGKLDNKRKKCPHCGGPVTTRTGQYVVVEWKQDGRYRIEDALGTFQSEAAAQKVADRYNRRGGNTVVRFLTS